MINRNSIIYRFDTNTDSQSNTWCSPTSYMWSYITHAFVRLGRSSWTRRQTVWQSSRQTNGWDWSFWQELHLGILWNNKHLVIYKCVPAFYLFNSRMVVNKLNFVSVRELPFFVEAAVMMSLEWIVKSCLVIMPLIITFMIVGLITNVLQACCLPLWCIGQWQLYRKLNAIIIYWFWGGELQESKTVTRYLFTRTL